MGEGQRVGGHIDLRQNLNAIRFGQLLQFDKLRLRIAAIASRQSGIGVALQAECTGGLLPIVAEVLLEGIVVEMDLQEIHLIIGHDLHQVLQIAHRNVFTAHIDHKATAGILRHIDCRTTRQFMALFQQLLQGAGTPQKALCRRGFHQDPIGHLQAIALLS